MYAITMLQQERELIHRVISKMPRDTYLEIPSGFDNNIAWNLGHIIVVQQLLHYRLSHNKMYISDEMVAMYRTGTSPADWASEPDIPQLLNMLLDHPGKLLADYDAGKFNKYQDYTTSTGIRLQSIVEAISFNHFHEGLHLGAILAINNLVK